MKTIRRQIYITDSDNNRLRSLLSSQHTQNGTYKLFYNNLRSELDRAILVASKDIPEDVVTMNSQVILTDLDNGETVVCTLVFPGNSDFEKKRISILAPVGTAIIGCKTKNVVEFDVPAGRTRLRIDEILYQPEAAGDLSL